MIWNKIKNNPHSACVSGIKKLGKIGFFPETVIYGIVIGCIVTVHITFLVAALKNRGKPYRGNTQVAVGIGISVIKIIQLVYYSTQIPDSVIVNPVTKSSYPNMIKNRFLIPFGVSFPRLLSGNTSPQSPNRKWAVLDCAISNLDLSPRRQRCG